MGEDSGGKPAFRGLEPQPADLNWIWFVLGTFGVVFGMFLFATRERQPKPVAPVLAASAPPPTFQVPRAPPEPVDPWSYLTWEPEMSKGLIHWASTSSTNELRFSFPYSDPQHATLNLIVHPVYGRQLKVSFDHGQFICSSYDGCTVQVRFDDGDPQRFSAMPPSDNSTTTLFLQDYERFVTQMKRAKRVRVAATVYQQGAPVLDFDVHGFGQAKLMAKPAEKASK